MGLSQFIQRNFDSVKYFKSIKALNKIPFDFKSQRRNLGTRQHALIAALKSLIYSLIYSMTKQHLNLTIRIKSGPFISQILMKNCLLLLILEHHFNYTKSEKYYSIFAIVCCL